MSRVTNMLRGSALPAGMAAGIFMIVTAPAAAQQGTLPAQCVEQGASARADHAINTKGTGATGRADGGADCDDLEADCGGEATARDHVRFDPIVLDLKGDGRIAATDAGNAGASAAAETAIGKKDIKTSASQSGQTLRHAINTKGTGATGRTDAAAEGAGKYSAPINITPGKYSAPINITPGKYSAPINISAGKYTSPINVTAAHAAPACPLSSAGEPAGKERVAVKSGRVIPKH